MIPFAHARKLEENMTINNRSLDNTTDVKRSGNIVWASSRYFHFTIHSNNVVR